MNNTSGDNMKIVHKKNHKQVSGTFQMLEFEEGDHRVLYLPSLNLTSYGKTYEEATVMMRDIVIPDFCENLMAQSFNKVISDLKELGWEQSKYFTRELSKTHIDKEGILRNLDLSETTVVKETSITV